MKKNKKRKQFKTRHKYTAHNHNNNSYHISYENHSKPKKDKDIPIKLEYQKKEISNNKNTITYKHKKKKKKINLILIIIFLTLLIATYTGFNIFISLDDNIEKVLPVNYEQYYSQFVKIKGNQKIYKLVDGKYIEDGMIYNNVVIELVDVPNKNTEYFKIKNLGEEYYIKYDSIMEVSSNSVINTRYKNYIPFNENIITKSKTTFYDNNGKIYTINKSFSLPIIIKEDNKYYVEFDNKLLHVLKEDVEQIISSENTNKGNTSGVPILNYHFVYDPDSETCNQILCHTEEQFRKHLSYIKENEFFTPTMDELEKYIDGKLQLPKSVVITIDDGRNVNLATKILEEYKLNATAFIVTSRYNMETEFVKSEYVELHSHSHNLHNAGTCPAGHGQGGGLTCLDDETILLDLKTSRELLSGSKVFCYPFYEYNSHSIDLLKKAGFTMAFAGEYAGGKTEATVGIDKFRIPRWVIVNYTTMDNFISYVN